MFKILALKRMSLGDQEFKASLGCMVRPCFKKEKKKKEGLKTYDVVYNLL
jgi:hypothetical protein